MVAGLLCIYILWLGFELQVFGVKTGFQLGINEGSGMPMPEVDITSWIAMDSLDR